MLAELIVNGLYVIPLGPVNTFFLESPDGCALIDTGVPNSAGTILKAITELGKKASDVRHIVLTHAHPDHIGSFAALKQVTGAEVYIHQLDAGIATSGKGFRPIFASPGLLNGFMFRKFINPSSSIEVESASIDHLVIDGETLPIADGLKAIHIPGHSAGQLAFFWAKHGGVMFVADACKNLMGLGWSLGYEDFEEGKRSLKKLAQLEFQIACFGHGKSISRQASGRFKKRWG